MSFGRVIERQKQQRLLQLSENVLSPFWLACSKAGSEASMTFDSWGSFTWKKNHARNDGCSIPLNSSCSMRDKRGGGVFIFNI